MHFDLRDRTVLLAVAGSRAYGIHRPDSDVDLKGVAVPPARVLHGYAQRFEQADSPEHMRAFLDDLTDEERAAATASKVEGSVYALAKLVRLAAQCNPNILDVLYCRDAEVRRITPLGERLRAHRQLFLSARARHTFAGYAASQLKRIQLHWRWHHQGPERQPTRGDYGLPERTLIPADQLAAAQAAVRKQVDAWSLDLGDVDEAAREAVLQRVSQVVAELAAGLGLDEEGARWLAAARWVGLDDNVIELMQREREYGAARDEWRRYQTWKRRRNPERAALEAAFGYDVKHGAHLVRLLRMGREILETGEVHVWRGPGGAGDAEELLAIRGGAWPYPQLLEWVEAQEVALARIYDAGDYPVPHRPDVEAIDRLCVELTERVLADPSALRPLERVSAARPALPFDAGAALGFVRRHLPPTQGRLLQCAVSGSHLYGFTSPDSDVDLKGLYLAPTRDVLGLRARSPAVDTIKVEEEVEWDLTLHEVRFGLVRLLSGDGNALERLLSPLQLVRSAEVEALQALARGAIGRHFFPHYRGYFAGMRREATLARRLKAMLYAYRVALTGIHLLRTGEVEADLSVLAPRYGHHHVGPWIRAKRAGGEHADARLSEEEWRRVQGDWEALETSLVEAHEESVLPPDPANRADVEAWLVSTRLH